MRILWLHQFFATPEGWGAVRTYEFARRFCEAGHSVDVLCCAGYDPTLDAPNSAPCKVPGLGVHVCRTAYRPQMGFVRRLVSFALFMVYALGHVIFRGGRYDLVIASSGPLTIALPALVGHWLRRLPYVFEVIDVWPDSAIAAGVLGNPLLQTMSFKLEALAYRHAAAIATCSTGMTSRVEAKIAAGEGLRREEELRSVVTISNSCDLAELRPDQERRRDSRLLYGLTDEQTVVVYTGAMGRSNAIGDIVAAVRATAGDVKLVWWFVGDGPEAARLRRECEAPRKGGVRWFGRMCKRDLCVLYGAADINLITFRHEPLFFENSPNKFFDGIAAGLPAVFNRSTWLAPWIERYGCGIVCPGVEPGRELAEVLRKLAADPERRRAMGAGARRLAEEVFDRDKLAAEYLAVLERVAGVAGVAG